VSDEVEMANGKENLNVTIDPELIHFLKEHSLAHDRSISNTVQIAIKIYLSIEEGMNIQYWKRKYNDADI